MTDSTLLSVVQLDLEAHSYRTRGMFDAASAAASLSDAVRSGQLHVSQLHGNNARCRLFGARQLGL